MLLRRGSWPSYAWGPVVGFPQGSIVELGGQLKDCCSHHQESVLKRLATDENGATLVFILAVAAVCIVYRAAVAVLRCVVCSCLECFLKYAYRIGVGLPSSADS